MHLQMKGQIIINASAQKVWHILAHEFGSVGQWASSIPVSQPVPDAPAPAGAVVGGRVCTTAVPGVAAVREMFTYYDEASMRFGYEPTEGQPWFVRHAENHWAVHSIEPEASLVESRAELELAPFPGVLLAPLLKLFMGRVGARFFKELKYYAEHDQPHPRKLKAQQKSMRVSTRS